MTFPAIINLLHFHDDGKDHGTSLGLLPHIITENILGGGLQLAPIRNSLIQACLQCIIHSAACFLDQFTRENEAFRENPLVSDFLAAELAFCRMMQEIGLYVTDQMKFE